MFLWIMGFIFIGLAEAEPKIKDITDIYGMRDNNLLGYGLVTGLQRTGDTMRNEATIQTLSKRLQGLGVTLTADQIRSRNVAVVMVTAILPATARPGQRVDVLVSSAGDATSLEGGVLQLTQLQAPNGETFALAQGPLTMGGYTVESGGSLSQKNNTTVGRVSFGATVEKDNNARLQVAEMTQIDLLLRHPDFSSAQSIAKAINDKTNYQDPNPPQNTTVNTDIAVAVDSSVVSVAVPQEFLDNKKVVEFIAELQNIEVTIDTPSKIVINERTGTIVMGGNVKISKVAIAHGGLSVEIVEWKAVETVFQENPTENKSIVTKEADGEIILMKGQNGDEVTVEELVNGLNKMKVKPRDLIQILIAIKASGAMHAELEVI
jgi:flagellar P-ring protein precursor FlgI